MNWDRYDSNITYLCHFLHVVYHQITGTLFSTTRSWNEFSLLYCSDFRNFAINYNLSTQMSFKWWYDPRNGFQSHWNINLDTKIIIVLQLEPNLWQIEINVKMAAIFDAILDLKNAKPVVTSHPAWISSQRYSPTKYAKNSLLPNIARFRW